MEYKLQNTKFENFWNFFFVLCTSTVVVVDKTRKLCFVSFLNVTFVVDVILQNTNFNLQIFLPPPQFCKMVENKVIQAKSKSVKKLLEKLKAPQLEALQYLLAANAYVSIIEGSARRKKTQKEDMEM